MSYSPEGCKLLIEADKTEEQIGGILVPRSVQQSEQVKITRGVIVSIGPTAVVQFLGKDDAGEPAKIGDRVLFARYGGVFVKEDGKDLRFINDKDVLARID